MMIAHASIPADNPKFAAKVLAEIMQGEAVPFPPAGPNAWMAWSRDGDIELEIAQRGDTIRCREHGGGWERDVAASRNSETHLAICVDRPEPEIMAIAQKAGWPTRHCERGGGYFSLVEVWVDGAFMIEFLDPAQTSIYRQRVTLKNWKAKLAEMASA